MGQPEPTGGRRNPGTGALGPFDQDGVSLGDKRVLDTPISETAFIGLGVGAAVEGMRPIVELMFADFFGVCMDQIYNHMAKIHYESGGNVRVPMVLMMAAGGGYSDGAQHSQCLWGTFAHLPGMKVVVPSNPYDAKGLMTAAIDSDDPVVYVFHKGVMGLGWISLIYEMDADFSHDPNDLGRLYNACQKDGADVAIGSRYISGVNVVNWPLSRVLMSYIASIYVRMITGMKIMDTTAGFICYRKEVLENIKPDHIKSKGYGFQIEMKFAAWKLGYKIVEIPIIFTDRQLGASKMSGGIFNEALWGVLKMKLRSIFTRYPN